MTIIELLLACMMVKHPPLPPCILTIALLGILVSVDVLVPPNPGLTMLPFKCLRRLWCLLWLSWGPLMDRMVQPLLSSIICPVLPLPCNTIVKLLLLAPNIPSMAVFGTCVIVVVAVRRALLVAVGAFWLRLGL